MSTDAPLAVAQTLTGIYTLLWDDRRYDEWIDLFADDARFDWRGRLAQGRDAIQAMIGSGNDARPPGPGVHLTTNIVAARLDGAIHASADFAFVATHERRYECLFAGRTYDTYAPGPEYGWRFASRTVRFLGDEDPSAWPRPWPPRV